MLCFTGDIFDKTIKSKLFHVFFPMFQNSYRLPTKLTRGRSRINQLQNFFIITIIIIFP